MPPIILIKWVFFTFRRNPLFLIERKVLEQIKKKNRGSTKPREPREVELKEIEERTVMLQV